MPIPNCFNWQITFLHFHLESKGPANYSCRVKKMLSFRLNITTQSIFSVFVNTLRLSSYFT